MSTSTVRIEVFPSHHLARPAVDLHVQIPMDLWVEATRRAGIHTTPSQAQLFMALQAVMVMPGHGAERLTSMAEALRKGDDLAKEVLSWKELDAVPLGRLVRAIIAAGAVLEGE